METTETAMETDEDGSGGTSPSRQGARTETYVPRNLSAAAAELRNSFWKILPIPLGFSVPRLYIGEGASLEVDRGGLTHRGAASAWATPPWCVGPLWPHSISSSVLWKLR
jgi:hypothetical protein